MLVLSRKRDQTIRIGDDVEIMVIDTRRGRVQLGITAPSHVQVHREEIHEAVQRRRKPPPRDGWTWLKRASGLLAKAQ